MVWQITNLWIWLLQTSDHYSTHLWVPCGSDVLSHLLTADDNCLVWQIYYTMKYECVCIHDDSEFLLFPIGYVSTWNKLVDPSNSDPLTTSSDQLPTSYRPAINHNTQVHIDDFQLDIKSTSLLCMAYLCLVFSIL